MTDDASPNAIPPAPPPTPLPPTQRLYQDDAYLRECDAVVLSSEHGEVILDKTVFYPEGGGQPGDFGTLSWEGGQASVINTTPRWGGLNVVHALMEGDPLPPLGSSVRCVINWERRYLHMRTHTCMHLLSAAAPYPVSGGQVGAGKGRLDFDMPEPPDKIAVENRLKELVAADLPVSVRWITEEELDANPSLVKTMSVSPPRGRGKVRLLEIAGEDLQPCGGTHVARTGEIGAVRIGKIEKKGSRNRRVRLILEGADDA